jgi:hypothetical protein
MTGMPQVKQQLGVGQVEGMDHYYCIQMGDDCHPLMIIYETSGMISYCRRKGGGEGLGRGTLLQSIMKWLVIC